ncbi:MAG: penicillin-binding transpeptidase domain-containing protein [Phototrophicales bacterium]|nr:penicillin-binding transpeptidase domain-containing protein [Phototrophicales bacterium]
MKNRLMPFQGWRLTLFQGVMVATFIIFTLRMYQMQIIDGTNAQIAADDNRFNSLPLPADRGVIFDRYDQTLARNVPAYVVRITPANLPADRQEELIIYTRLSALTGVPPTRAIANASGRNVRSIEELVGIGAGIAPFRPVPIAQDVPLEVALQIMEDSYNLPGVDVLVGAVRQYPSADVTSHIIGYMGPIPPEQQLALIEQGYDPAFDRIGYDGLERFLETLLSGQRGRIVREVDVAGQEQAIVERVEPVAGQNIRLTIDVELQRAAQQALIDQVATINEREGRIVTEAGVVMVMNPNTGEILAMVSYPNYDNSRFARSIDVEYYLELLERNRNPLLNQAIGSLYPPGSAWKLITAAAVLEEDIIDAGTGLFDGGDLLVQNFYAPNDRAQDQRFVCWARNIGGHAFVNMVDAIAYSCNVYFYQVGGGNFPAVSEALLRRGGLGINNLVRYATALGIGSELGLELPGELAGRMPDPTWKRITRGENWSTGDTYNAAFGQGYVNVTPLQLMMSVSTLVNDGVLYQPTVIRDFVDAERNITVPFEPKVLRTVNLDYANPDGSIYLLQLEDMIIRGENSLACLCEFDSPFYNPLRCDSENYVGQVDVNPALEVDDIRDYRIHIPLNYVFNGRICDPLRFDSRFVPAFLSSSNLEVVREGMREAVIRELGTAKGANLPYIEVAGKTGTAEYCDDIAGPLGLCNPGAWPAHAWFTAYTPYENPEILVVAFIYNGIEGSSNALPVAVRTIEAYYRLKNERENQPANQLAITPP